MKNIKNNLGFTGVFVVVLYFAIIATIVSSVESVQQETSERLLIEQEILLNTVQSGICAEPRQIWDPSDQSYYEQYANSIFNPIIGETAAHLRCDFSAGDASTCNDIEGCSWDGDSCSGLINATHYFDINQPFIPVIPRKAHDNTVWYKQVTVCNHQNILNNATSCRELGCLWSGDIDPSDDIVNHPSLKEGA